MSALERQEGGSHYKGFAIQPLEFCQRNKLDYCQANIVKYVCRFRSKGGIGDLQKARHYLDYLEELEYGAKKESFPWPSKTQSDSSHPEQSAVSAPRSYSETTDKNFDYR